MLEFNCELQANIAQDSKLPKLPYLCVAKVTRTRGETKRDLEITTSLKDAVGRAATYPEGEERKRKIKMKTKTAKQR